LKIKLKNIATIQTGIFANTVLQGEIVYLKAKHFDENGQLRTKLHPDLYPTNGIEKHFLKPDDIIFAAKGPKNFAAIYESKNQPAVASTSFLIIRLNKKATDTLPEYLAWFLNHHSTQKLLKRKAIGSNIVSISKAALGDLEIYVPDLQKQEIILKLQSSRSREKELKKQIEILKEKLIQQQILNGIK